MHLTALATVCNMPTYGGLSEDIDRIRGTIYHRRILSRLSLQSALVRRIPMPPMWTPRGVVHELFYRLVQQAVAIDPVLAKDIHGGAASP